MPTATPTTAPVAQVRTRPATPPSGTTLQAFLKGLEASEAVPGKDGQASATTYEATLTVQLRASDLPAFTRLLDAKGFLTLHAVQATPTVGPDFYASP